MHRSQLNFSKLVSGQEAQTRTQVIEKVCYMHWRRPTPVKADMPRSGHVGGSGACFRRKILKFRTLCGAFLGILGVVLLAVQRRYNAAGHTHKIRTTFPYAVFHGSA